MTPIHNDPRYTSEAGTLHATLANVQFSPLHVPGEVDMDLNIIIQAPSQPVIAGGQ